MLNDIVRPLLKWYDQNKRELPWRDKNNAYYTWISEIMLQQTRVEAVKPYFSRFIEALPNIEELSNCDEKKLLKLWEGLGYYNRVRNMQKAAIQVMTEYQGTLPADYQELLKLTGIGSYTAGAIASIAYGIPVPAVDGNVLRVVARLLEDDGDISKQSEKKRFELLLKDTIPKDRAGDFNQAMMELGATVCIPNGNAKCENCPISELCMAHKHGTEDQYPIKSSKKERKIEERTVFIIQDGRETAIQKRPDRGLLAGLYEFPNQLGHLSKEEVLNEIKKMNLQPLFIEEIEESTHIFSHIEWRMIAYRIRVEALEDLKRKKYLFINREEWHSQYAIPSAFQKYRKYLINDTNIQ